MLRSFMLLAAAALITSAAVLPTAEDSVGEDKPFKLGDKVAADITLKDVNGKAYRLGDFRKTDERDGKIVVLDFWSINCPVSVRYEERMKKMHAWCKEKGVQFFAVDSNHTELDKEGDPYARIKAYAKKAEVGFPILIDRGNVFADRLNAKTTPHIFILDAEGKLRYDGALDNDSNMKKERAGEKVETYAVNAVRALLAGEEPPQAKTKPQGCSIKRVKRAAQ